MSHNPYTTQPPTDPPRPRRNQNPTRRSPQRACDCPNLIHEHGCYSRYDPGGCRCEDCRQAGTWYEASRKGRRPSFDIDWVNIDRLTSGQPVTDATPAEVDAAILWLTDRGYSARQIWRKFPIPITHRRVTRARARRRARLEVAA